MHFYIGTSKKSSRATIQDVIIQFADKQFDKPVKIKF
jgi:hypothetical protein